MKIKASALVRHGISTNTLWIAVAGKRTGCGDNPADWDTAAKHLMEESKIYGGLHICCPPSGKPEATFEFTFDLPDEWIERALEESKACQEVPGGLKLVSINGQEV